LQLMLHSSRRGCYDNQQKDTQTEDTQHNDIQRKNTQHNARTERHVITTPSILTQNVTSYADRLFSVRQIVVMLKAIMLSVMAP